MAQDDKNIKPNLIDRGSDDKNLRKGPRFNIYWIYALIALGLIGYQVFSQHAPDSSPVLESDFLKMVSQGDVTKVDIIDNKKVVRVYVSNDSIGKKQEYYRDKIPTTLPADNKSPLFEFRIDDTKGFRERLDAFCAKSNLPEPKVEVKSEGEWYGPVANILITVLLFVVMIFLFMRKMGGPAGGGGPGGIFNIGKSKAQLFEKGTKVNINFADVAGLDEAKVEVMEIVDFLKKPKKVHAAWW